MNSDRLAEHGAAWRMQRGSDRRTGMSVNGERRTWQEAVYQLGLVVPA